MSEEELQRVLDAQNALNAALIDYRAEALKKISRLRGGIKHALSELGVPGPNYPANVAEAVGQLQAALEETT